MPSEHQKEKAKATKDAAVSVGGSRSGGVYLAPELVAHVATFADAVSAPDVMNICLAVGPDTSRIVRYYYLWRNRNFLNKSIGFLFSSCQEGKVYSMHMAWMKVNSDWRTTAVRDDLMDKLKLASKDGQPGQKPENIFHPFIAFNNPAVAATIGLFDSLKHLVEDKGIDINSFEWSAYGSTNRMHLLFYAAFSGDKNTFRCLLDRLELNIRCMGQGISPTLPLFAYLLGFVEQSESEFVRMFMEHPEFHINRQIIPWDVGSVQSFVTPLFCATDLLVAHLTDQLNERRLQRMVRVSKEIRVLLSAGADPNLSFPECKSPIAQLRYAKSMAEKGLYMHNLDFSIEDYKASERYWDEAVALLEEYD